MTPEIAAMLREPFPPEKIGKLPKVTCGDCRDSRGRVCEKHTKNRCDECKAYITSAHMHVDFVGHADTTDRLLEADPEWNWEPFALDPRGLPAIDDNGGMWIRLTVSGVTKIGYGDADGKRGGNAVKETIGDAIRNASMRFGVALDLWRKEPHVDESTGPRRQPAKPSREQIVAKAAAAIAKATTKPELDSLGLRVTERESEQAISGSDAVELRRQIVARLDVLFPAGERHVVKADQRQHRRMRALWGEIGMGGQDNREKRLARTSEIVGRNVDSSADLTAEEADKVIDLLDAERRAGPVEPQGGAT